MTDQQLYSKNSYEIKANVSIEAGKDAQILKTMLYMADYLNKVKINHTVANMVQAKRVKVYEQIRRQNEKKK